MKGLFTILLLWLHLTPFAQDFANSWIDFNQVYFKIPVHKEGVYRIQGSQLAEAGANLDNIDPRNIQIFHRGEQVSISVPGEGDAILNESDYIEFYARKNDGTLDSQLYLEGAQPHNYYNLFSDTTYYFLTWKLNTERGKRISQYSEVNVNNILPVGASRGINMVLNTSRYAPGANKSGFARRSQFDFCEGWTGQLVQENQFVDYIISNIELENSTESVSLEIQLLGESNDRHAVDILAGPDAGGLVNVSDNIRFDGFVSTTEKIELLPSLIANDGSITVRINVLGVSNLNDLISVPYVKLEYPSNFDLNSEENHIELYPDNSGKIFVSWDNPPPNFRVLNVTDPIAPVEINKVNDHPESSVIRNTENGAEVFVFSETEQPKLQKVDFTPLNPVLFNYYIISHNSLMKPVTGSDNPVADYGAYRASSYGGSFKPFIINMEEVYNQFSYGEKTPLSIYNFVEFIKQGNPGYLFLIGKGTDVRNAYYRTTNTVNYHNLVPTSGFPGSDLAFTAGKPGSGYMPDIPVGRITASTAQEVKNYLDKVVEMESVEYNSLWRKKILHLSGGITGQEQTAFFNFMDGFGSIAKGVYLGGTVNTIRKNTTETVSFINISEEINEGVNLVTFFGHSSPSITDIDIGFVSDPLNGYNNRGKYPAFLINGCEAGLIYNDSRLFGEDWILAQNKGAISFIAHSSYGLAGYLRAYSDLFYQNGYGDSLNINKSIGQIQLETIRDYLDVFNDEGNIWHISQVQQMILMGDPAVSLFGAKKPDYQIADNQFRQQSFSNEIITSRSDSFQIQAVVKNFGIAPPDSIDIHIDRFINNRLIETYNFRRNGILSQDTLLFTIFNPTGTDYSGENRFVFTLDPGFDVDELNELNNTAEFGFFIPRNSTRNIWPYNFSIAGSGLVDFIVQSTNPLAGNLQMEIEVDSTGSFNSPVKQQYNLTGESFIEFKPDLSDFIVGDTSVIFWRSRLPGSSDNRWNISSFTYMKNGSPGWNQGHFHQFMENKFEDILVDSVNRRYRFIEDSVKLDIITYGADNPALNTNVSVKLNDVEYITNNLKPCRNNTVNIIAFNRFTAVPYAPVPYIFQDARTCGRQPQVINSFIVSQRESGGTGDFIESIQRVSEGDSVVIFTIGDVQYSQWSNNLWTVLETIGLSRSQMEPILHGEPVIIVGKKGAVSGNAVVIKANGDSATEEEISFSDQLSGKGASGEILAPHIGPAKQWNSFSFRYNAEAQDENFFTLTDVEGLGTQILFPDNNPSTDISVLPGGTSILLRSTLTDSVNQTPSQLQRYTVNYQPVPEGLLLTDRSSIEGVIEFNEGEDYKFPFFFYNASDYEFRDSLKVEYKITGSLGEIREQTLNINAPLPGDSTSFTVLGNTLGLTGNNSLSLVVNPGLEPEQHYDNNGIELQNLFFVLSDEINPVINVRINNRFIADGEIVSANPVLEIDLRDENELLLLNDTTYLNVFLKRDCETCVFDRLSYSRENVSWSFDEEKNILKFRSEESLSDGVYALRVEAVDASGNKVSEEPYSINFEVISESTVTNFYPYPNPFSDHTQFVFTLTGSEIPDEISIRILTISGKVVREITKEELGPLHIGNNKSDFFWDGTDMYGDKLANGVYLYRVLVKHNGEVVNHRDSGGDAAFKNGLGKIYIAR